MGNDCTLATEACFICITLSYTPYGLCSIVLAAGYILTYEGGGGVLSFRSSGWGICGKGALSGKREEGKDLIWFDYFTIMDGNGMEWNGKGK